MGLAQFNAAYDVKVQGAWALVQALQGVQPDFLAFFSSAAALMGNRGQSNYVAGCLVQDALAHHLEQICGLRAKAINWGRWGEIGAVANEAYNERLDAQGVLALHPRDGLDAIEAVLSGSAAQVAVLRTDEHPLAQMGAELGQQVNEVLPCALPMPAQEADSGEVPDAHLPHPVALQNGYTSLNRLACEIALHGLAQLAEGKDLTSCRTTTDWRRALGVVDQHSDGFAAMLQMFRQDEVPFGDFTGAAAHASALGAPVPTLAHLEAEKARLLSSMPWLTHEIALLWACGMALPGILKGEIAATSVIFPDMSMAMVEGIYRESPLAKASNRQVARRIAAAVSAWTSQAPGQPLRIVEIGAGTGGTTAGVLAELDKLAPESLVQLEYVYTDISPAFLNHGKAHFSPGRPYLRFELLDIEKPMATQGQQTGGADIVMASNVLHATRDLSRTVQHVKYLLKRGGTLVLNEVMRSQGFLTMTFGLLEGWWLAQDRDKRLPHSPLLSEDLWRVMMADEGMVDVSCRIAGIAQEWCQGVLTASSDGCYIEAVAQQPASVPQTEPRVVQKAASAAAAVSAEDVAALFAQDTAPAQPQGTVLQYLRGQLAQVLQLHDEQFDQTGRPLTELYLSELGVDSLTAMDLRGRLRAQLGVNAPVEVLLGGTRIAGVIEMICDQLMVRWLMARRDEQVEPDAQDGAQDMESFTL
jgi:SAM-dependent methyltransferase